MDKARNGETMKLGAFFHPTGNHVAAWLHPDAQIDAGTNFRHYAEITQTAEPFATDPVGCLPKGLLVLIKLAPSEKWCQTRTGGISAHYRSVRREMDL
jgi:hypothetical protein